ncbi:MAG: glutamate racemase [Spirochaetaceae bacterium]|nr:glutamate racemase [Spirochaetaceae bacterium]
MPAARSINFSAETGGASMDPSPRQSAPLVFLDSGVGGLPYLKWVREHAPQENFIYIADRKNFPYGPKNAEEVFAAMRGCVEKALALCDPKLFVLACNTASVCALEGLRAAFPDRTFVGTVPAVKPAAEYSRNKRIGVLATAATVHARYLDDLVARFASFCAVIRVAGTDIVSFVEKKFFTATQEERLLVVADAVEQFREEGVDVVVLACTHFLYLFPEISSELGDDVLLMDSREGVGRRVISLLSGGGEDDPAELRPPAALRPSGAAPYARLYLTGNAAPEAQYRFFADSFGLQLAGTL